MRVGIIARSDRTGLGNQTRNLVRMIRPDEIMLIDSKYFNGNGQHPEMYAAYNVTTINGFPNNTEVIEWLRGLDVVVTCEIFYNNSFVDLARQMGVKTINQYNWEFADYLRQPELTLPDRLIAPSQWNVDIAKNLWGDERVQHLAAPFFVDDFAAIKEKNLARTGRKRFLHTAGRIAVNDRNGTLDLIKAMQYSHADFELVIKIQAGDLGIVVNDPRIIIDRSSPDNEVNLFEGFDALIIPRRYGGQCMPMAEALLSGLPVIMTDVSPNSSILPNDWLVPATLTSKFMTRTIIDLYTVDHAQLGAKMDWFARLDLAEFKTKAYNIGYSEFSNYELEGKWEKLIRETYGKPEDSGEIAIG